MKHAKKIAAATLVAGLALTGCTNVNDSDVVNENISTDADNFKILRQITFINGITDKYLLTVEGYCQLETGDAKKLTVTCKVPGGYKREYIGLSDNVTYMVQQLNAANVSPDHYKIVWKPEVIVPTFEKR